MKMIIAAVALLLIVSIPCQLLAGVRVIKGGRDTVTEKLDLDISKVTKITASTLVRVDIVESDTDQIEVTYDKKIDEFFVIEVVGGDLRIYMKAEDQDGNTLKYTMLNLGVKVPYNNRFNSFEASSAAKIDGLVEIVATDLTIVADGASKVKLMADIKNDCTVTSNSASGVELIGSVDGDCYVTSDSASSVELTITASELHAKVDSASSVKAKGRVEMINITADSMSSFNGEDLICNKGTLSASGVSTIRYKSTGEFETSKDGLSTIKNKL